MKISRIIFSTALCVMVLPSVTVYAENCTDARLVNGLELEFPCVLVNKGVYSTKLKPILDISDRELAWYWDGVLNTVNCIADTTRCTLVGDDLNLSINAVDIDGVIFQAQLAYAPDLPGTAWRYMSHTIRNNSVGAPENVLPLLSDVALTKLRKYMTTRVVGIDKQVPGAVLGIAQGNSILMLEAFGLSDVSTGTPMTTDNLLHIGSTNKALTSFLIAVLVDEGVLQWDTRAQEIYPAFTTANPQASSSITIRQLLDMSSGLRDDNIDDDIIGVNTDEPPRRLFDQLSKQEIIGNPGEQYEYSNLSVSLAAYLATLAVAKQKHGQITEDDLNHLYSAYVALLKTKVLDPIGMNSSFVPIAEALATGRMAKSHILEDGRFTVAESEEVAQDNDAPAGGLKSTVNDMLRYIITDMQQGVTPDGQRIASVINVAERQKLSPGPAAQKKYGLCLEIGTFGQLRYIGHDGSFDNFNSLIGFFPDKQIAFVLLTNGDSPAALDELTATNSPTGLLATLANLLNGP